MSMFVAFPYEDRIEVLTDGAVYLPDGLLMFTEKKIHTSPDVPAAITGRGNRHTVEKMTEAALSYFKDYGFAGGMRCLEQEFNQWRVAGYDGFPFQLWIGGYWEGQGLRQFTVSSHDNAMYAGTKAMQLNTLVGVAYAAPPLDQEEVSRFLTEERVAKGCGEFGVEFSEYLRNRTDFVIDDPEKRQIHMVGGHIDWTTITSRGASTRRLLTWPDMPFQYIDATLQPIVEPEAATPDAGNVVGLMAMAA